MSVPEQRVGGVVLAAGQSTRMGRPKPLLPAGDRSFLVACISALRAGGCDPVVAVVANGSAEAEDVAAEARAAGAEVVWNPEAGSEQIVSLRVGLDALEAQEPEVAGAFVLPVDHPLVAPATVRVLIEAVARGQDAAMVRPVYDGLPGHPTYFPRNTWTALRDRSLPAGARSVLESGAAPIADVAVADAGVLTDIDTPEAYRAVFGEGP